MTAKRVRGGPAAAATKAVKTAHFAVAYDTAKASEEYTKFIAEHLEVSYKKEPGDLGYARPAWMLPRIAQAAKSPTDFGFLFYLSAGNHHRGRYALSRTGSNRRKTLPCPPGPLS